MFGQGLGALKEEVKKWEREANLHKNRADMQRKIDTLRANLLWAKVCGVRGAAVGVIWVTGICCTGDMRPGFD